MSRINSTLSYRPLATPIPTPAPKPTPTPSGPARNTPAPIAPNYSAFLRPAMPAPSAPASKGETWLNQLASWLGKGADSAKSLFNGLAGGSRSLGAPPITEQAATTNWLKYQDEMLGNAAKAGVAGAAFNAIEVVTGSDPTREAVGALSSGACLAAGAKLGGTLGSAKPGLGTAAGAFVGGIAGAIGCEFAGEAAYDWMAATDTWVGRQLSDFGQAVADTRNNAAEFFYRDGLALGGLMNFNQPWDDMVDFGPTGWEGCGDAATGAWVPDRLGNVNMRPACDVHDARWTGDVSYNDRFRANAELGRNIFASTAGASLSDRIDAFVIGGAYTAATDLKTFYDIGVDGLGATFNFVGDVFDTVADWF